MNIPQRTLHTRRMSLSGAGFSNILLNTGRICGTRGPVRNSPNNTTVSLETELEWLGEDHRLDSGACRGTIYATAVQERKILPNFAPSLADAGRRGYTNENLFKNTIQQGVGVSCGEQMTLSSTAVVARISCDTHIQQLSIIMSWWIQCMILLNHCFLLASIMAFTKIMPHGRSGQCGELLWPTRLDPAGTLHCNQRKVFFLSKKSILVGPVACVRVNDLAQRTNGWTLERTSSHHCTDSWARSCNVRTRRHSPTAALENYTVVDRSID